jgi:REP element-mobilizing transposase RayT
MNRTAGGPAWIRDRSAMTGFLARVAETCARFPVDVHAYCVLPRHYHLLVRAEPEPLREALANLEAMAGFPRVAEPRHVPVMLGRHLMGVSRYIHLNPVDAGLVWCPEQWPYSSFRAYLGDLTAPRFILTGALLGRFGTIGARHRYRAYVYAGLDPGTRDGDGRPRWSSLFCTGSTAQDLAWRIEPVLTLRARPPASSSPPVLLHRLARAVAQAFDVSEQSLRSVRGGGPSVAAARGALVYAARAQGDRRLRDVASFMGYASPGSAAAAAERFDGAMRLDPRLAVILNAVLAPRSIA